VVDWLHLSGSHRQSAEQWRKIDLRL